MLLPNPAGNYRFLPGIEPYSCGVVANPGFEIVHMTLSRLLPWRDGFKRLDEHLRAKERPRAALCAVELRCPAPFTRAGFLEFNDGYIALLQEWGLLVEGRNPLARTHVAPKYAPPPAPSLHAFSYVRPAPEGTQPTFVVAGAGDLGPGGLLQAPVIRAGETSAEAMREKAAHVVGIMERRLAGLERGWAEVTAADIYTVEPIGAFIEPVLLQRMGAAALRGLRWHHARPPIDELAFEMDLRGARLEETLSQ